MSSIRSHGRSPGVFQRFLGFFLALGVATLLAGCAQLPTDVERPVSTALASPDGTALDALVQERRKTNGGRAASGFLLMPTPQAAYGSRLTLVEAAQKTLDLQYYAIHADASSERLLRAVAAAAKRGVRVRILLDDFHGTGRNALVMRMGFEPNIEMRMFNPLAGARGSTVGRMVNAVGDFNRAQQRMHNKLFVADNAMAVTGGRNLGDAYFGIAQTRNFVDLDVLAAGPIVRELSSSFDHYWNNERAYPVQSLVTRQELSEIRDETRAAEVSRDGKANDSAGSTAPEATIRTTGIPSNTSDTVGNGGRLPDGEPRPTEAGPTDAQRVAVWDQRPLDLQRAEFVWAPAAVMVDKPAKIPSDAAEAKDSSPGESVQTPGLVITRLDPAPSTTDVVGAQGRRVTGLVAATEIASDADTVVDGLLNLISQSRQELLIISPYFVPGPDMLQAFATARERGVRIRVLTNSLASNDAPVAHVGYARHREKLLALGVELYELRSEHSGVGSAFGTSGSSGSSASRGSGSTAGSSGLGESRAMLHSKVLVMDKRLVVIGSMNLDQRSQLQNTEIALLIRSAVLAQQVAAEIDPTMTHGAWHVQRVDGDLVWRAPQESGVKDATTEPDTSTTLRVLLKLFGPLVPEELL
ncbi:MAG: phospholipase D family protein [Janthinobacterium lividum]